MDKMKFCSMFPSNPDSKWVTKDRLSLLGALTIYNHYNMRFITQFSFQSQIISLCLIMHS